MYAYVLATGLVFVKNASGLVVQVYLVKRVVRDGAGYSDEHHGRHVLSPCAKVRGWVSARST